MVDNYKIPTNKDEYEKLRGLIFLFNIGMKTITVVHELIIHLNYGYLNYLSEGKILNDSPRKGNSIETDDGGLYFEHLLFGKDYGDITLNDILLILNGMNFSSLYSFKEKLGKEYNPKNFSVKSEFLEFILKEYDIGLKDLEANKKATSTMKSPRSDMYIRRVVALPYSCPTPYAY